ncbi:hypothetical protein [Massilia soli]|uniref:Uncharacterized protein n=1 Tax=Massilia soli TaxID=2792854 RepID=A0ABS7SRD5_9BURK|nr:hypothetical protein [Massilia soli]MBZ2208506.1 hypothetical protein [Massilia soli]
MDNKMKSPSLQAISDLSARPEKIATPNPLSLASNPYFNDANRAPSELFHLLKDGLPSRAANADDRLRLMAVQSHAENEIQSIADGLSAIGSLVSLSGQVADDAGIPGITLIRLGILINQLADTLDAVHELTNDAAFALSQSAGGAE